MTSLNQTPAIRARLVLAEEKQARKIADILAETFDGDEVAVAVFETSAAVSPAGAHAAPHVVAEGPRLWELCAYFGSAPNEDHIRALIAMATDETVARETRFEATEERDWVQASLEGLPPVEAGRFIVHGHHDRAQVAPNRIGIEIEAALAFGTGHHGTTRGCLVLLNEVLKSKRPKRILDLGSGTGVLAIAAARVLRRRVLATDIDRPSAIIARENAWLNGVGNLVESIQATGFSAPQFARYKPFDLVLANILANPLRALAPHMARHVAPNASIILSGLLPHHMNAVVAAYRAQGMVLQRRLVLDGWASLLLTAANVKSAARSN